MRAAPRRSRGGLTLVELVVVIALVALLAMIAAPSFRELIVLQRVKGTNAEIVTDLQFARSEAARRNRSVFVRFPEGGNCYVVYTEAAEGSCDCTRPAGSVCDHPDREEIKTVRITPGAGVTVVGGAHLQRNLRFDKISGSTLPVDFQITVTGDPRGQLQTRINQSGRPSVCSPDGSFQGMPAC